MKLGGNLPCIMNAANEIAVEAFLNEKVNFMQIPKIIEKTLEKIKYTAHLNLDDYIYYDNEARKVAKKFI